MIAGRRALRESSALDRNWHWSRWKSCNSTALVKFAAEHNSGSHFRRGGRFRSAGSGAALMVYPYCGSDLGGRGVWVSRLRTSR